MQCARTVLAASIRQLGAGVPVLAAVHALFAHISRRACPKRVFVRELAGRSVVPSLQYTPLLQLMLRSCVPLRREALPMRGSVRLVSSPARVLVLAHELLECTLKRHRRLTCERRFGSVAPITRLVEGLKISLLLLVLNR